MSTGISKQYIVVAGGTNFKAGKMLSKLEYFCLIKSTPFPNLDMIISGGWKAHVELLDINSFKSSNVGWFAGPPLPTTR